MGLFGDNTGSTIAAAGSLLGAGINAASQGTMNKKTRQWNEKMYNQQRANALADWNMQNAYNSPAEQMARLKAAGLNPNLVYGNGATSVATAMPRNADIKAWNPRAPSFDVGSTLGTYYDTAIKKQTLTNMDAQEKVLRQEALNKAADLITKGISQNRGKLAFDIEQATKENVIAKAGHLNDLLASQRNKVDWDTEYTRGKVGQLSAQLDNLIERTAVTKAQRGYLQQQLLNAQKDGTIKQFEIKLNKMNITKGDPAYLRLLQGILDEISQ